jgi:hypothetical protein
MIVELTASAQIRRNDWERGRQGCQELFERIFDKGLIQRRIQLLQVKDIHFLVEDRVAMCMYEDTVRDDR